MNRRSDGDIATIAEQLRRSLGIRLDEKLDVLKLVQKLQSLGDSKHRIEFRSAIPSFMRGALAKAEPKARLIHYRDDMMGRLASGEDQARLVFAEEIAHVLLKHEGVLNHSTTTDVRLNSRPELLTAEDEAQKMAWYLLASVSEAYSVKSPEELVDKFGFPKSESKAYFEHILATRRQMNGETRPLPAEVISLLDERNKRRRASNLTAKTKHAEAEAEKKEALAGRIDHPLGSYLPEPCSECGRSSVVIQGGCKHCRDCGEDHGCS